MSTSVATNPTERVETDSAVLAVQEQRLPQLLDAVKAGALCASTAPGIPDPDDWYPGDGESIVDWHPRREQLLTVCAACPVRAACEESALRQGEGGTRNDEDMVRGGRTGAELYTARAGQAVRLAAAQTEDRRALEEERELRRLAAQLRTLALVHRDSRSDGSVNERIRAKAAELQSVKAARRARSGWSTAA